MCIHLFQQRGGNIYKIFYRRKPTSYFLVCLFWGLLLGGFWIVSRSVLFKLLRWQESPCKPFHGAGIFAFNAREIFSNDASAIFRSGWLDEVAFSAVETTRNKTLNSVSGLLASSNMVISFIIYLPLSVSATPCGLMTLCMHGRRPRCIR